MKRSWLPFAIASFALLTNTTVNALENSANRTLLSENTANFIEAFSIDNADIKEVALFIAKLTGRGIVFSNPIRGKITIDIKRPVTSDELWDIFSQALVAAGYTVRFYENKNVVEIVPLTKSRLIVNPSEDGVNGEYTLAILQLKHLDLSTLQGKLKTFLSTNARLVYLPQYRVVIVADFSENVEFVKSLLRRLDKRNYEYRLAVYKPKYIDAKELEKAVMPVINWYRTSKKFGNIYFSTLQNRNIFVLYGPQELQSRVEQILKEVDVQREEKRPGFYILKLQFTSVEEVEKSINSLFGKIKKRGKSLVFPSGLEISFDKTNNAILVFGSKEDFENFKEFIKLIDRRKKQVLITATIVEASAKDILDKGVRWQILGSSGGVAFGATSREGLYEALSKGQFVVGTLSTTGKTVSIGGNELFFPDLLFLYSLLEQGTGFHVISNPKILTLDNQKATIKVGQDVPFPTGIKYDVNGNPIITYDYKYVGLDLDVLPRISQKNLRLIINLKVQEITGYLSNNVGGINYSVPITSTRELNSDIIVQNGQTIIIGGLISNKNLLSTSKVPLLGDIPILGNLFKSTHKEKDKTNLFIFITPYVISSPEELAKIMEVHKKLAQKLLKKEKQNKTDKIKTGEDDLVEKLPYN